LRWKLFPDILIKQELGLKNPSDQCTDFLQLKNISERQGILLAKDEIIIIGTDYKSAPAGGYDIVYNDLDFTGKPLKTLKLHNGTPSPQGEGAGGEVAIQARQPNHKPIRCRRAETENSQSCTRRTDTTNSQKYCH